MFITYDTNQFVMAYVKAAYRCCLCMCAKSNALKGLSFKKTEDQMYISIYS